MLLYGENKFTPAQPQPSFCTVQRFERAAANPNPDAPGGVQAASYRLKERATFRPGLACREDKAKKGFGLLLLKANLNSFHPLFNRTQG